MSTFPAPPSPWRLAAVLLAAFLLAAVGSSAARLVPGMAPPYWLPAGIGIAVFLIFGPKGALLCLPANLALSWSHYRLGGGIATSGWLPLVLAALDTGQAWLAAHWWRQRELAQQRPLLRRPSELGFFWTRVCLLPPLIWIPPALLACWAAMPEPWTLPAAGLQLGQHITGNVLGILLVTPCLVAWRDRQRWYRRRRRLRWWPGLALPLVTGVALLLHGHALMLLLPVLLAVTVYYRFPGVAFSLLLVALLLGSITAWGTGTFAGVDPDVTFFDLQVFLFSVTLTLQYLALGHEQLLEYQRELKHDVAARTRELKLANERLAEMATTDELTGVTNRREWQRRSAESMMLARRTGEPLSVLMLDLDHFKHVNDTYGHLVGDLILRAVSRACLWSLRTTDHFARWGGEEFVVMLPDTALAEAAQVAEKLRLASARAAVQHDGTAVQVTISIGVTALRPADLNLDDLVRRADAALYAAKRAGRNRVVIDTEAVDG
ncbi:GGDEF domain-containing protein [Chitiniphilus purpureus]|uniref:diguanylate cyclase n=1 Tax=Chitiniphilus purpureus TaxID=2981137 RepID=A0ABY6DPD5_9NEIS|nr:GGDEF domain-containing protein [Chitiniphilus sp. CD1]UXY16235.1 GGDEF domain-containing protein [Chitiniphilus sp. CD1]